MIFVFKGKYNIPKWVPFVWNIFLGTYSAIAFYYFSDLVPKFMDMTMDQIACSDVRFLVDDIQITNLYIFTLSKVMELPDTFFIVTRNRYPIFLHWFHHIATMWYVWYVWYLISTFQADSFLFATMNTFVHSIMYPYYAFVVFIPALKQLGPFVTIIQLSQMVIGTLVAFYQLSQYYFTDREFLDSGTNDKQMCHVNSSVIKYSFIMYMIYLVCFAKIFVNLIRTRWFKKKEM